nr:RHS repeat-associated core domain-containing protein [Providencia rettgeri]
MTACFTPKGDCWRYTYDAFGRRLSKTKVVDSQAAHIDPQFPQLKPKVAAWHYLWSGDQMVEETPIYADGTIAYDSQVQWLYEPGSITPTARYQNGKLHYVVTDHQGTPREIFTEAGKATWAGRLNTWGQMQFWQSRDGLADNDPNYTECHFRFAGQYEDRETGLYYNRFRYYDKDNGQYISPDPIGLLGGVNPYGYVHCPTNFIDPLGLISSCSAEIDPKKFDYFFGRVSSNSHNTARSHQMAMVMKQLGVPDTPAGHKLLSEHLINAAKTPSNVSDTFTKTVDGKVLHFVIKESLFAGPSGKFAQFNSTWEVIGDGKLRLTTVIPRL